MTDTELISAWIARPALLGKEQPRQLQNLSTAFPYFSPLHYLNALHRFDYEGAPLHALVELFPANRVLLYQLFVKKKEEPAVKKKQPLFPDFCTLTHSITGANVKKKQPLFPDQELKAAIGVQDYFAGQGIPVASELPAKNDVDNEATTHQELSAEKNLMVVMSFSEWLRYLEAQTRKAKEEEAGKSALRAMWQKQKLTAAIEEEEEEIPENVFEMAVNSISSTDEIISESMAAVYALQGKKEKALEMYKKLSLQNPEKSAYFAKKVEDLQKETDI